MRSEVIDLEEEARKIREEQIPGLESAQSELVEKAIEEYGEFSDVPQNVRQTYRQFDEELTELRGQAKALEDAVEEWGDGTFVIENLTTGQLAAIQDRVAETSFDFNPETGEMVDGTPKQGYGMIETLREAISEAPDAIPTRTNPETGVEEPDAAEIPHQVGLYLFEKVNNFNTTGEADLGNSSLRERMQESKS